MYIQVTAVVFFRREEEGPNHQAQESLEPALRESLATMGHILEDSQGQEMS